MGAAVGALAVMSTGLAPTAVADDVHAKQWYLHDMLAERMWKVSTGKGIKVAVIDSGVNPVTPSLKGKVLADDVPAAASYGATRDYDGHGTTMAELIAGSGAGDGLQGLAPGARIIPVRAALTTLTDEAELKKTASVPTAIRAAADSDAQIISMSLGREFTDDAMEKAVKYAATKGKLMFAAVGNDGDKDNFIGFPAAYPEVVGVGAADKTGTVGKFSQSGDYIDLASPGVNVPAWCDATFKQYCQGKGTSQATAIASASAALVWSAHPKWTASQVLRVMIDTAGRDWPKNQPSKYLGYGLIRPAQNLIAGKGNPGAPDVDPITNEKTSVAGSPTGATPSTSVPASSQPPKSTSGGGTSAAGSSAKSSDSNDQLWIVLGAAAAVVVLGGGAFAVVRAKRSS
ncbi:S8 family serine peptidase [Streptomyces sp. NPDC056512]|uniref:S8 family serine peptidase n=1 Tax=Streptomyces sp. NPDC056512 TaxID=3345846 RepID=UPI0036C952BC